MIKHNFKMLVLAVAAMIRLCGCVAIDNRGGVGKAGYGAADSTTEYIDIIAPSRVGEEFTVMMSDIDEETKRQVIEMCHEAVLEIKSLLAEMKQRREYVAEAYLSGNESAGNMISLPEWSDKVPPKASWDK